MRLHRILAFAAIVLLIMSGRSYSQSCPSPSYPSPTPSPIDSTSCGPAGKGGDEAAQNEAKNNFRAPSPAKPITIPQMVSLQTQVQKNKSIPFGNPDSHPLTKQAGPATDRAPLVKLG